MAEDSRAITLSPPAGVISIQTMIAEAVTTAGSVFDSNVILVEDEMQATIPAQIALPTTGFADLTMTPDGVYNISFSGGGSEEEFDIPVTYYSPSLKQMSFAEITVFEVVLAPVFSLQPVNQTETEPDAAIFTAAASDTTSWQWEAESSPGVWANADTVLLNATGTTTDTMNTGATVDADDTGVRVQAIGIGGTTQSTEVTLTVNAAVSDYVVDTFTDTNGTLLENHTPETDVVGGGWVKFTGSSALDIVNNQVAHLNDISVRDGRYSIETNQSDVVVSATLGFSANGARHSRVYFRVVDADNYWMVAVTSRVYIYETTAGSLTEKANFIPADPIGNYPVVVTCDDETITVDYNNGTWVEPVANAVEHKLATSHGVGIIPDSGFNQTNLGVLDFSVTPLP